MLNHRHHIELRLISTSFLGTNNSILMIIMIVNRDGGVTHLNYLVQRESRRVGRMRPKDVVVVAVALIVVVVVVVVAVAVAVAVSVAVVVVVVVVVVGEEKLPRSFHF